MAYKRKGGNSIEFKSKVILLVCNNCKGMTEKLIPEIYLQFPDRIRVLATDCPTQMDSFLVIRLLKRCAEGVIIACPQGVCCCPANKSIAKRREVIKDILPVFGFHREQLVTADVSPLDAPKLIQTIEQLIAFVDLSKKRTEEYRFLKSGQEAANSYKWLN